jgi:hypothetical protein
MLASVGMASMVAGTRNCHYLLFNAIGLSLGRMSSQQTVASQ